MDAATWVASVGLRSPLCPRRGGPTRQMVGHIQRRYLPTASKERRIRRPGIRKDSHAYRRTRMTERPASELGQKPLMPSELTAPVRHPPWEDHQFEGGSLAGNDWTPHSSTMSQVEPSTASSDSIVGSVLIGNERIRDHPDASALRTSGPLGVSGLAPGSTRSGLSGDAGRAGRARGSVIGGSLRVGPA